MGRPIYNHLIHAVKARIARAAVELIPAEAITFFYSGSTVAKRWRR